MNNSKKMYYVFIYNTKIAIQVTFEKKKRVKKTNKQVQIFF